MIVTKRTTTTTTEEIIVRISDSGKVSVDTKKEIETAQAVIDAISVNPNLNTANEE